MRILHIDSEMEWRGGENQMRLLVEGLAATGEFECHLGLRPGAEATRRLAGHGPIVELPMRNGIDPRAALKIARYCREHRIDVVDTHSSRAHSLALMASYCGSPARLVVHRRVDYVPGKSPVGGLKYRSPKIDRFVAISAAIGKILERAGVPSEKIRVVPSATSDEPFRKTDRQAAKEDLARALGLDDDMPFFGNASALTDQKGHATLIKAVKILKDRGMRFHCVIAGDGPLRGELEHLRLTLDLDHEVTFLGFVEDVPKVLGALDVLALSSNYEGLGTILLDATHAGCCLVASDVGGIPEVVIPEKTGLLVPVGDTEALADKLERVLTDASLRQRLFEGAKTRVAEHFSLESMVKGNIAVYRELA